MCSRRQRGLSLIEVVVFILVLGIGIVGVAALYNQVTQASVDPLVRKQAVAIANSLLEEIQLRPFTICDPDDANVFTATVTTDCTPGLVEVIGTEGGETRYASPRFDNVSDYHGFAMTGSIQDVTNSTILGLTGYSAQVQVTAAGADFPAAVPADDALLITVTITTPANAQVVLHGYRLRYAPNSP